ncbi:B-cell receptor CD22-like isoform X2 [Amphiprion ocellaris]|uniref:B-cell receptor CD22-like isoform X2 n=1 Tax=Amphiprion ocellaris TaxID=80972 RepID=UPI000C30909E|nr:B-cell receptor CD22-like isoform X2 [Amphiprion ocellaris]
MKTFCFLLFLLAGNTFTGVGGQSVNYKHSDICAVRGSTVTLPCTFTPPYEISRGVANIKTTRMEVVRVVWCKNHEICQGGTPSVYNSESTENQPRYRYLGDKKGNCTLQILDLQANDDATFRFRMETKDPRGNFTGTKGVNVIVVDEPRMEVVGSSRDFNEGETVTLRCSSLCTFHQLKVNWSKDGYALPESGPTIQIGPLTAKDSGNYSCALRTNSLSAPFSLQLEPEGEHGGTVPVDRVVLFTLHTVLIITVVLVVIKRTLLMRKLQQKGSDRAVSAAGPEQTTA